MKKTIVSLFLFATALFLLPLSSEAAQLNFYDIDTLSPQEQVTIIKDKPSINLEYEQYNLIYTKASKDSEVDKYLGSGNQLDQKTLDSKSMNPAKLPKAGELNQTNLLLYGSVFIVISVFVLYKRKKYSKLLLLIIIPTAIGTTSITVLATGDSLIPAQNVPVSKDEIKVIEPVVIEGYLYVGYYPIVEVIPPSVESTVTILYVDGNSNELHEAKTIRGTVGEAYDVSTEQFRLPITDYTLNEDKLPNNSVGTFKKEPQTVIYEYKKEPTVENGKVTIQYLDLNGTEIKTADILSGEQGQAFRVEQKEIVNYLFDHKSGELEGVFSTQEQVIQLYYTDEVKLTIHYLDKTSKQPLSLNSLLFYAPHLKPDVSDIDEYYYTNSYNGKTYEQGAVVPTDQLTVKVGTTYTLPKEIRFLITKPTGETMNSFQFPKPVSPGGGSLIMAIDSYSNFLYFHEKPEYIPVNYTGTADQLEINVTYELAYIPRAIAEP